MGKLKEKLKKYFNWKVALISLFLTIAMYNDETMKMTTDELIIAFFIYYAIGYGIAKALKERKHKKQQKEETQPEPKQEEPKPSVEVLPKDATPEEPEEFELPIRYKNLSRKLAKELEKATDFPYDEISHYLFEDRFAYRYTKPEKPERLYLLDLKYRIKTYLELPPRVKAFEVAIFYNEPMIYVVVYGYKELTLDDPDNEDMHLFLFKISEKTGEITRYHSYGQFFLENVKSLLRKNGKYYLKYQVNNAFLYSNKKEFKQEVIKSLQDEEAYISKLPSFLSKKRFSIETEELLKIALANREFCWGLEEKLRETDQELPIKDLEKLLELAIDHCRLSTQATVIAKILEQTSTKNPEEFKAYFEIYINKGFLEELINKEKEENRRYISPVLKELGEKLAETPHKQEALQILNLALKYNPKIAVKRLKKKLEKELTEKA